MPESPYPHRLVVLPYTICNLHSRKESGLHSIGSPHSGLANSPISLISTLQSPVYALLLSQCARQTDSSIGVLVTLVARHTIAITIRELCKNKVYYKSWGYTAFPGSQGDREREEREREREDLGSVFIGVESVVSRFSGVRSFLLNLKHKSRN